MLITSQRKVSKDRFMAVKAADSMNLSEATHT